MRQIRSVLPLPPTPYISILRPPPTRPSPADNADETCTIADSVNELAKSRRFDAAWRLLLDTPSPRPLPAVAALIRRYARAAMPSSAIRTFEFFSVESGGALAVLLDALCKEGRVAAAAEYFEQVRRSSLPTAREYNVLMHGWIRARKLRKAESLWAAMAGAGVNPTVVSYGTLIEGYCRMRRPDKAKELLSEMKTKGIEVNLIVYNPIIDALAEDGRFEDASTMLEKMPLYNLVPNISTFNSLVKGYCKIDNLAGASKVLKSMIGREILPTAKTYNYFFKSFARSGKVEEAMNLYMKMVGSGYEPDRFTYHLLVKMLCEKRRLNLALQVVGEMEGRGFEKDLTVSTMLVHLLGRLGRIEDACVEFEEMVKRGLVPQFITYKLLMEELRRPGWGNLGRKMEALMNGLPHSTKLPDTFRRMEGRPKDERVRIIEKARAMSDVLKTCKDPRELRERRGVETTVSRADKLIADIKRRVYTVQTG